MPGRPKSLINSRITRRRFMWGTTAAGFSAAFLAACGGDDDTPSQTGGTGATGATGGTGATGATGASSSFREPGSLVFIRDYHTQPYDTANAVAGGTYPGREAAELFGTLDPMTEFNDSSRRIGRDVYEYLLRRNIGPGVVPGSPESLEMVGAAAESWEQTPDGLTYTFKLRPGIKYHNVPPVNGREMTIEDWRTSLERFFEVGAYRQVIMDAMDHPEFPDDSTMVWHLKEQYAPLVLVLDHVLNTFALMPQELNADPELAATTAIGSNYRVLTRNETSVAREFTRHNEYWAGQPYIENWKFPVIPEYANAQAQFIAKNTINFAPTARDTLSMRGDVPDAVMVGDDPSYNSPNLRIGLREKDTAPWADPRVRIAMRRAVDFQAITDVVANVQQFANEGVEMLTTFSTHAPCDPTWQLDPREGQLGEASQNYLYDPAEAKKLLEAAGHPDGFEINFVSNADPTASPTYNPAWYERNDLMAAEYEKTGFFTYNMEMQAYSQFVENIVQWDHKGFLVGFSVGADPDIDRGVYRLFHSTAGPNGPAYPDEELDRLLEAQRKTTDINERISIIHDFQKRAAVVFPSIPVWGSANTFFFEWPWVHNIAGWRDLDYYNEGHLVWLDENMPNRNG